MGPKVALGARCFAPFTLAHDDYGRRRPQGAAGTDPAMEEPFRKEGNPNRKEGPVITAERRLADLVADQWVEVGRIRPARKPDPRCRKMDLRTGEVLRCLENAQGAILLARTDGRKILLPDSCARSVTVRLLEPETIHSQQ